ncbi:hypothetical protein D3C85_1397770 [compost metagenome]
MRGHFKVQLPETLLAKNVGDRLTGTTPLQIGRKSMRCFAADDTFRPGVQIAAALAQGGSQQQLDIQARGRGVGQFCATEQAGNNRHLFTQCCKLVGLVFGQQRFDDCVHAAGQYVVEGVQGQVDAVIGDTALRIVVGADALGAIA